MLKEKKFQVKEYKILYGACIKIIDRPAFSNELSKYYIDKF